MIDEDLEQDIIDWIQKKVEERGADGVVVGLSGGIDSSVSGALAKKAYPENSLGVLLPVDETITKDIEYANMVADKFDLDTIKVNLKDANNALKNTFEEIDIKGAERNYWPQTQITTPDPASQNIQTRLRMVTLYYIAEKKNYLVLGTNNKSEILAGFYTLHGDGATDMRPLGDLYKTEVWKLAEQLGVPQEIIDHSSTGDCRGDKTNRDEKEFGVDYETLDKIHQTIHAGGDLTQFEQDDINRVIELLAAARDKEHTPMYTT